MAEKNSIQEDQFKHEIQSLIKRRVCGAFLYSTDHGNQEITYHCSSEGARFWDFERGAPEQIKAKEYCDNPRMEQFMVVNDALQHVIKFEPPLKCGIRFYNAGIY